MSEDMKILFVKFDEFRQDVSEQIGGLRSDVNGLREEVGELRGEVSELRGEVGELRGEVNELRGKVDNLESEVHVLKGEVSNLRIEMGDLKTDVYGQIGELKYDVSCLREETQRTRLILEQDISKKIDLIGEGHDFLKDNLDGALRFEKDRERMGLELISLRMDVRRLEDRVNHIA